MAGLGCVMATCVGRLAVKHIGELGGRGAVVIAIDRQSYAVQGTQRHEHEVQLVLINLAAGIFALQRGKAGCGQASGLAGQFFALRKIRQTVRINCERKRHGRTDFRRSCHGCSFRLLSAIGLTMGG